MTLKQHKLEITDRVVGKLENGQIQLYVENEKIGNIELPEGYKIHLEHHYETDQQKIYQNVTSTEGQDARYTDCDEGGWC